ncbi:MAG: FHA domain-containing protein, partial [Ktedonobacterales bacterium]|nr:FHA domain-containing protein [Ktedonobacterales bacterium]
MTQDCPNCGRAVRPGDRFCLHCGQRLSTGFVPPFAWGHAPAEGAEPATDDRADSTADVAQATPFSETTRPPMSQPPRFNWKTADGASHEFVLTAAEIAIGRAPTCDIVLNDDQMVSRRHAIVRRNGNVVTVVDLGSSNGTLVNGAEIHDAHPLKDGDKLTIGDHDLMFTGAQEGALASPASSFAGQPAVETIRIGGSSVPPVPAPAPIPAFSSAIPPLVPPAPFLMGASADASPVAVAASPFTEQNTGDLGFMVGQSQSSYSHSINGQEVEREESSGSFQSEIAIPPRQDAAALLSTIQSLHDQLNEQIRIANQAADQVRSGVRDALGQLEGALNSAQSTAQQAALADLRQLADNVS